MDFGLSPGTEKLRVEVAAFAAEVLAPCNATDDAAGVLRPELVARLGAAGLLGLRVGAEFGGRGLSCVDTGIALEEAAKANFTACYPVLNHALIADVLATNGNTRALPALARGDALAALCLTEPEYGSDAAHIATVAEPDGDGWRISGVKASIMLGTLATHGLVFARTGGPGARGVSAFYVPLEGVRRVGSRDVGNRAGGRATLHFDGLRAGPEDVLGGVGGGFVQVMRGFDYSRALIALMCVGCAQASLDEAWAWARQRHAFGKPIGALQGVAFPLVEHQTMLRGARLLALEALWRKDNGLEHSAEAGMAKWWAPKAAMDAAHQALLTFGQHAWSEDSPMGQRMRDVIGLQIGDGTAQVSKLVAARAILGRDAAP